MAMSYLDAPLGYKIRKVLRYASIYGVRRTAVKVRGQFHLRRSCPFDGDRWWNPACRKPEHPDRFVAIVGCGNFGYSGTAWYLSKESRSFLRAAMDTDSSRAKSLCRDYRGAYATTNVDHVLDDPAVRLVYIVSNHASHAEYAIRCLEAGKHVYIEKPNVVTNDQLQRLVAAQRAHPEAMVFLGFNRPRSEHFRRIQWALASEPGAIMMNWFIAGHEIPDDHWYFREEEGGRVLGNLCHWTDLSLQMVGVGRAFPCVITPTSHPGARADFSLGIRFADGSVAGITFSVKGHLFEGVREVLQAHRGDTLIRLWDFDETLIETLEKRYRFRTRHRDHGHGTSITGAYVGVRQDSADNAVTPEALSATSRLILGVKEALDTGRSVTIESGYDADAGARHQGPERSRPASKVSMIATAPP